MRMLDALLLASLCLVASRAPAQQLFGTVHAGVAQSHIVSNLETGATLRYGIAAGAGLRLMVAGLVGIQAEAVYVEKGRPDLHLSYWEFPILARVDAPLHAFGLSPAVVAGIAPARLAHCAFWAGGGTLQGAAASAGGAQPAPCGLMITETHDFGVVAGLELARELRRGRLGLELRYTQGRSNIASGYSCCWIRNRTLTASFSYAFRVL
jgi:hypothetical protein